MVQKIISKSNEKYKLVKSLIKLKNRSKEKKYIAEGLRTIELALEYGKKPYMIVVNESFYNRYLEFIDKYLDNDIYIFSEILFKKVSLTENSQGIIAVIGIFEKSLEDISIKKYKNILVLDRIQDPGNMGTIIRTADAAGFNLIILIKGCVDIYNPKVVRSAMGSLFYVDIIYSEDIKVFEMLKENNFNVISSSLKAKNYFDKERYEEKTALVVGNEANGISDFWMDKSDKLVKIPMYGKAESLNVAISSALLMYQINKN